MIYTEQEKRNIIASIHTALKNGDTLKVACEEQDVCEKSYRSWCKSLNVTRLNLKTLTYPKNKKTNTPKTETTTHSNKELTIHKPKYYVINISEEDGDFRVGMMGTRHTLERLLTFLPL